VWGIAEKALNRKDRQVIRKEREGKQPFLISFNIRTLRVFRGFSSRSLRLKDFRIAENARPEDRADAMRSRRAISDCRF